ncbi:MAG: hypothetical protein ACUVSC_07925, partial [Candidatus Fervidibacter sp.]|uniref:hypothetical protein n=1 Tax=Candidatus Fervidibacter sp. TaxID=3100871 RepID=UPI00404AA68D
DLGLGCPLFRSDPLFPLAGLSGRTGHSKVGNTAEILITNWGALDDEFGEGRRFWLCLDCGRHLPYEPKDAAHAKQV